MSRSLKRLALVLVVLGSLAGSSSALAASVSVRIELPNETFQRSVTTGSGSATKDGDPAHSCDLSTVFGALETATDGAWTGHWDPSFGGDYFVDSIRGVTLSGGFWSIFVNQAGSASVCKQGLSSGDKVLFYPASCDASFNCTEPSEVRGPGSAAVNTATTFSVVQYDFGGSSPPPAPGAQVVATISGAPTQSGVTDSQGNVALSFPAAGTWTLQTVQSGSYARSEPKQVVVSASGSSSSSGTATSGTTLTPGTATPGTTITPGTATTTGTTGTTTGSSGSSTLPATFSKSIDQEQVEITGPVGRHHRFSAAGAPFRLPVVIDADPRSIRQVKFRLRRTLGDRCWSFSGSEERFRSSRCGHGGWFAVSKADADEILGGGVRFQLPLEGRLRRGRYVFDVKVQDQNGDYTALERGRTREVFFVAVPKRAVL